MTTDELKAWRESRDLTQVQMARYIGVPTNSYINWETGVRTIPSVAQSYFSTLRMVEVMCPVITDSKKLEVMK